MAINHYCLFTIVLLISCFSNMKHPENTQTNKKTVILSVWWYDLCKVSDKCWRYGEHLVELILYNKNIFFSYSFSSSFSRSTCWYSFFSEEPLTTQDSATVAKMFGNINKTKELYPSGCDLPTYRGFLKLFVY